MGQYEINWIKEPIDEKKWCWLKRIFCTLGHYYDDYIEKLYEMPFNYTERSILGSLAIAADRSNYYTLLDYSTKTKKGYHYPDFWITLEPIVKKHDVVFEAKRFECSFKTKDERFKEGVTKKIKDIHDRLNEYEIGKAENVRFQCALLAFQFRIDDDKWRESNSNSYDKKWHKFFSDQEKRKNDNTEWPDEKSICSFWYLYWVPFNKIKNREFQKYYWKLGEKRRQYCKPALGLLVIGSFRKV
jgi:hypothetical protein